MFALIIFIALFDIFSPILISSLHLPQEIRWISYVVNLFIIIVYLFRKLMNRRVYSYDIFLLIISIITVTVAISNRQQLLTTLWGLWLFLRYPLIGVVFSEEKFSQRQNRTIEKIFYSLLFIEIFVQFAQWLSGIPSGDNLAGTFYQNGTGKLIFVLLIIIIYFAGKWISQRRPIGLLVTLAIGIVSSAFGEMKLFFFASILILFVSVFLYYFRYKLDKKILYGFSVIFVVIIIFPKVIDKLSYSQSNSIPFWKQITDSSFISRYTTFLSLDKNGRYDMGRNFAVQYVWKMISRDEMRLTFGDGIGSRGESKSLGSAGIQLLGGDLGLSTGSSLVVFLGEMGVLGLVCLFIFWVFTIFRCIRLINTWSVPYLVSIGYATLLFSFFWPIWLWYNTSWTLPGSMPFYWLMWGIVMHYSKKNSVETQNGI
jgi:hypothetical protein